ncbi:response regulator [Sporosalibacterium faouarense]|uniref:response regulator n=1 Tax=Sporosalibacterium faouarense TaxID=516123 RepID=UPI00192CA2CC|nr:response regulator [Sporosalibacterium faouarense]
MYKVLIINDNDSECRNLEDIIREYNDSIQIKTATTGVEGLEMINNEKPDFIFMEIVLPILNGVEICRIVKEQLRMEDTRVILTSPLDKSLQFGVIEEKLADEDLVKPYEPIQVTNILKKYTNKKC